MQHLFIVVRSRREAEALVERLPNSELLRPENADQILYGFARGDFETLVAFGSFATMGYRVPANTVILIGTGFHPAERAQIEARVPPPPQANAHRLPLPGERVWIREWPAAQPDPADD